MPKSKKRGGTKKHNNRVKARNQNIESQKKRYNKFQKERFEELLKQYESSIKEEEVITEGSDHIDGVDGPEV